MSTDLKAPPKIGTTAASEIDERDLLESTIERFTQLADLAHKINNPLTSVVGRAQLLRMKGQTDPNVLKALDVIDEATGRITGYVRELATIVREGKSQIAERLDAQADEARDIR